MKLHTDDEITIGSGSGKASKFRIAESAKAFKILSSNLYTHKIRAVIRELSCNACDAHILGSHKRNFNVILPTMLDPRFIIRDFGPGLSDEDVMNLYTTYFASTKSDSNDYIGALGLGSKSPFSYTETFSVVSNFEGVSRGYTAYLDNGEPNIVQTFVEETDEESGIEITIPVKETDINKFQEESRYLFRAFNDIKPNVVNLRGEISEFPLDNVFTLNTVFERKGFYAIMGNIVYPIQDSVAPKSYLRTRGETIFFRFPLGALDISPSREELSLDEETIKNIEEYVDKSDKIAAEELVEHLMSITNARDLVRKYYNYSSGVKGWINSNVKHPLAPNGFNALYNKLSQAILPNKHPIYEITQMPKLIRANRSSYCGASPSSLTSLSAEFVTILIDDKPSKRVDFVRGLYESGYKKSKYVIVIQPEDAEHMLVLDQLKDAFEGYINVYTCSEQQAIYSLAKKYDKPAEKRPKYSNVQLLEENKQGVWSSTDLFLNVTELTELTGYAVGRNRDDFSSITTEVSVDSDKMLQLASIFGIKEIYVLRPQAMKKATEVKDICLIFADKFVEYIDKVDFDQYGFTHHDVFMSRAQMNKLDIIESKLTDNKVTKDYKTLSLINNFFWSTFNKDVAKCKSIYLTLQEDKNLELSKAIVRFKEEHAVIHSVISNNYTLTKEIIKDINNLLK